MKFYRFFALTICFLIIFSSCAGGAVEPIATDPVEELTTAELTEAVTSVSLAGYKVIRSEKASSQLIAATVEFKKSIEATTENITIGDDWYKSSETLPEKALEILIGATNRPESVEVMSELLASDFAIKYFPESGRLVICGGSDEATAKAMAHFLEFCYENGEIATSLSYFSAGQYAVSECILGGAPIEEYTIVIPANANADEKYAAELITSTVLEKTGKSIKTVKPSDASGKSILINAEGEASQYTCGMLDGNVVLKGTGGLVVKAARALLEDLFPKGKSEVSLTLGEAKTTKFERASYPALTDFGAKPIALADQKNASIAVYDISTGEAALKYEFKPKTANGFSLSGYGNRVDEARLRYSEKWGTYVILFTSSSGYVGVASYPEEKCLFEAELKGTSPHSIEYLPNGLIAVASSGGSDTNNGFIRVYSTEKNKNNTFAEAKLVSAHAVLWDETREILWAMGSTQILAYEIGGDSATPTMKKIEAYGCNDMKGGHDLSAICGNDDQVWVGGSIIRVFDKTTGKLLNNYTGSSQINSGSVKCICSFPDGTAARTVATDVYASHDTDRFKLFEFSGSDATSKDFVFEGRAFYKARAFLAEYN